MSTLASCGDGRYSLRCGFIGSLMPSALVTAVSLLKEHRKFVVTTHMSSDGDGVGSQLALSRGLRLSGAEVACVNPTPLPENLRFLLQRPDEIVTPRELASPEELFRGALTIVVDMGAFDRLGAVLPFARQSEGILVIDHHRLGRDRGIEYLVDESACATGDVVSGLLEKLGVPLSIEIAEPLYVAIHTDTGGFRYPGTTPGTHTLAAKLLGAGVDPQRIYTEIFERQSLNRIRLTGSVLESMRVSPGGKIAWIEVRRDMVRKLGARLEDADDLVNYTIMIDGVVAGFFFKELDRGATKVSCRSRGDFAIDRFVSRWGGGGHAHAAGVRLELHIDDAERLIVESAVEALEAEDGRA